jgi:hypothetical protein
MNIFFGLLRELHSLLEILWHKLHLKYGAPHIYIGFLLTWEIANENDLA